MPPADRTAEQLEREGAMGPSGGHALAEGRARTHRSTFLAPVLWHRFDVDSDEVRLVLPGAALTKRWFRELLLEYALDRWSEALRSGPGETAMPQGGAAGEEDVIGRCA